MKISHLLNKVFCKQESDAECDEHLVASDAEVDDDSDVVDGAGDKPLAWLSVLLCCNPLYFVSCAEMPAVHPLVGLENVLKLFKITI